MTPYTAARVGLDSFNCPHCNAYAYQRWADILYRTDRITGFPVLVGFALSFCDNCSKATIWKEETILYPDVSTAPLPNPDLDPDIQSDHMEARSIVTKSPRGAAALLRLCIQKLIIQVGEDSENLNKAIGSMVAKGLSPTIQQALDTVRVIGNESVHPGDLDMRDKIETATSLFTLINLIAYNQITHPKEVAAAFNNLPADKLKGIAERDKRSRTSTS
jgi:hypothetical protein